MGKSKRTETSVTVTKKPRALPPIHESQERLAQRALECDEDEAIIIVARPGNGKTRAMGRYIKLGQEEGGLSLNCMWAPPPTCAIRRVMRLGPPLTTAFSTPNNIAKSRKCCWMEPLWSLQ